MWQSHPSAIRKSSQKSDDLDWNPIANTIGNIESIIGQGNPVATRGTKYSSRRFWLIARETPASVLATCQNPEAWKITQLRFIGNTLISANFVRFCQSAPLTRSTMKISSNEGTVCSWLNNRVVVHSQSSRFSLCFVTRVCSVSASFDR